MKPKIIYMGSPEFAGELLRFIIEHALAEVRSVWTVPRKVRSAGRNRGQDRVAETTPVGKVALELKLPLYEPGKLDEEAVRLLEEQDIDFALVVAYGKILPKTFLSVPRDGMFNLHFSLLPRHRGASPITAAILAGDKETGITIQKVIPQLDAGPIVLQQSFVNDKLNYGEVLAQSLDAARHMFQTFFKYWENRQSHTPLEIPLQEQEAAKATHCYKISKADTKWDTGETAQSFYRKWLAFYQWPGVWVALGGVSYWIEELKFVEAKTFYQRSEGKEDTKITEQLQVLSSGAPHLLRTADRRLFIGFHTDGDFIELLALKKPGKQRMNARDFINGQREDFPLKIDVEKD